MSDDAREVAITAEGCFVVERCLALAQDTHRHDAADFLDQAEAELRAIRARTRVDGPPEAPLETAYRLVHEGLLVLDPTPLVALRRVIERATCACPELAHVAGCIVGEAQAGMRLLSERGLAVHLAPFVALGLRQEALRFRP